MYVCKTLFQHAIFVNYLHQLVSTKGVLCTLNLKYVTKHTLIKLLNLLSFVFLFECRRTLNNLENVV